MDMQDVDQAAQDLGPRGATERLLAAGVPTATLNRLTEMTARLLSTAEQPVAVQVSLLTDVQTVAAGSGLDPGSIGSTGPLATRCAP